MSNKILTKAIVLVPLAAILINPSVTPAKEKANNTSIIKQEVMVAQKVKYEEEKQAFFDVKAVKYKGKWGFINFNGEEVIPRKYDDVIPYSNEAVAVKLKNKWGVADTTGKLAVPVKYKEIIGINIHHDDKKGATKLYANVIIKKENILLVYETKSKKSPDGGYNYKKWKKSK